MTLLLLLAEDDASENSLYVFVAPPALIFGQSSNLPSPSRKVLSRHRYKLPNLYCLPWLKRGTERATSPRSGNTFLWAVYHVRFRSLHISDERETQISILFV